MTGPEAGWYPDPGGTGAARYWDGSAWTDQVRPLELPLPDEPGPPPIPPAAHVPDRPEANPAQPNLTEPDPSAPDPSDPPPTGPRRGVRSVPAAAAVSVTVAAIGIVLILALIADRSDPGTSPGTEPAAGSDSGHEPALDLPPPTGPREVDPEALHAAGCMQVDPGDGDDRSHLDLATAPPAETIYDVPLPAWGPHSALVLPEIGVPAEPLDVRILLHNLEHGAIAVWFDPAATDDDTVAELTRWKRELRDGGFRSDGGSNIYVSATPPATEVAAISLRAWGVAVDCPLWDRAAADAFVAAHYGERGDAPERSLGPYPDDGPLIEP